MASFRFAFCPRQRWRPTRPTLPLPRLRRRLRATDPTPVHTLFETRQLDLIDKGGEVAYRFDRKVSDEKLLGKAYADDIKVGVKNVGEKGEREVEFKAFTGEQAREPSTWPDLTINPLFIWYLERAVSNFNTLAGGNQMYIKAKFRSALGENAKIAPTKIDLNGKSIDGYKITVAPFSDDKNGSKRMQGYEKSVFTIVVSKRCARLFRRSAIHVRKHGCGRAEARGADFVGRSGGDKK